MEYTQNYALRKPGLNEYANVGDLNFNADKIDSQMKKNQDVDGEVYDPTTTSANAYEAGDYVINPDDGLMYVCNGTTYGTWDATKWDHTTEFEELQKAMASGGESELADLHDVDITNPTDGQALLYDPTSLKWHNSDLPDADVTKEASGNPIEFTDGADAPLVKCVTEIQGYQEGSGTPSPDNIRPIVAYTEGEIVESGHMIWDEQWELGSLDTSTGEKTASNYIIRSKNYIPVFPSTQYFVGYTESEHATRNIVMCFYDENKTFLSSITSRDVITTPENAKFMLFRAVTQYGTTYHGDIAINTPSTFTEYVPYKGTTHTTTYPSAIYRGSEDVVNGEVTSEWAVVDLGDFNYVLATNFQADTPLTGTGSGYTDCICEQYIMHNVAGSSMVMGDIKIQDRFLQICDTRYNDATAFKSAVTGIKLVYKLSSPTTTPVTPTNLPIKSLSGYNHIESSTGEMEIEYFPAKEQPLIDLIPEASNMHEYSTEEHAVGTWIDGETIYEKTYTYSGNVAANPFQTTIDMTGKNIIEVIPHYARYTYNSGQSYGECIGSELWNVSSGILDIKYDPEPYTLRVYSFLGNSTESYNIAFTLRYTKTASNNRSLAKSAPTEEVKEEQVEELKEEPTEEVKEEVKEEETKEEGEVNER